MAADSNADPAQQKWSAVDEYICGLFVPADPSLEAALKSSDEAGLPAIAVAPNQGKLLYLLARTIGAKRILEIGTLGGYSTIWLARALPEDGHLISLEYESKHADVARANIARAGLAQKVEVRVGKAIDSLPGLEAEKQGPFDMVFIDADKPGYPDYLPWAIKLARPGSLIIADNVVRKGEVTNPVTEDVMVKGIQRFNELLAAESRVEATEIQTVGSKGYDGLAIIRVK